jgi:hypothetical protein
MGSTGIWTRDLLHPKRAPLDHWADVVDKIKGAYIIDLFFNTC